MKNIKEKTNNDSIVMCFTKANPPTIVHYQLFKKVVETANNKKAHSIIFLSQEYNAQKNPMPWKLKVEYIKEFFSNKIAVCDKEEVQTVKDALVFLANRNYKNVYFLTSAALEPEINKIIEEEKSKEDGLFEFDTIEVVSVGTSDPDLESSEYTYSPAQARNAILDDDDEKFKKIVMYKNDEQLQQLKTIIRSGMGLSERIKRGTYVFKILNE